MTTGVILGSNEQPVDRSESLVFSPNRIQDTNIGDVQVEQKMKPYTFTYLHVPPKFKIAMGLDKVENRSVTIHANSKAEAKKLFDLMMLDI